MAYILTGERIFGPAGPVMDGNNTSKLQQQAAILASPLATYFLNGPKFKTKKKPLLFSKGLFHQQFQGTIFF